MRVLSLLPTLLLAISEVHAASATDEHIAVELVSERNALVLREAITQGELAGFVVDAKGSSTTTKNTGAVAPAVGLPAA